MATKKIEPFKGFTPETIKFLNDLEENNYKEWFEDHRKIYEEELIAPFKSLITTMSPAMYNIDTSFELRPHRAMSRIYRDTRFSKNKDPYKTGLWITFQPPGIDWQNYPGYFMELTNKGYVYGMGLYMPKKKVMDNFRDSVEYNSKEFQEITQKTVIDRGFDINGDDYKRRLDNNLPEYFQQWYQKRNVWVGKTKPIGKELYSSSFADMLIEDFQALEWLYNFFKEQG